MINKFINRSTEKESNIQKKTNKNKKLINKIKDNKMENKAKDEA